MTARELIPALETDPDARRPADEWRAVTLSDCAVINDATYSPKEAWPVIHYLDTGEDIGRIADTYHAWRKGTDADVPGFCKSATLDDIRAHGHVLTPGRYVGAPAPRDDGEPFEDKMRRLVAQLRAQQAEAKKLDAVIAENLRRLGFGAD